MTQSESHNTNAVVSPFLFPFSQITEMAVLLSLMVVSSAEDSQLCLIDWSHSQEIELKSDVLLDNVRSVIKQIKVRAFSHGTLLVFNVISYQHSF